MNAKADTLGRARPLSDCWTEPPARSQWSARDRDRACAEMTRHVVAYALGVDAEEIAAATRGAPEAAFARQAAMYLSHVVFELSLARVAAAFGRDRTTAAHACRRIEDDRDDPGFDELMDALEAVLRALPDPREASRYAATRSAA